MYAMLLAHSSVFFATRREPARSYCLDNHIPHSALEALSVETTVTLVILLLRYMLHQHHIRVSDHLNETPPRCLRRLGRT